MGTPVFSSASNALPGLAQKMDEPSRDAVASTPASRALTDILYAPPQTAYSHHSLAAFLPNEMFKDDELFNQESDAEQKIRREIEALKLRGDPSSFLRSLEGEMGRDGDNEEKFIGRGSSDEEIRPEIILAKRNPYQNSRFGRRRRNKNNRGSAGNRLFWQKNAKFGRRRKNLQDSERLAPSSAAMPTGLQYHSTSATSTSALIPSGGLPDAPGAEHSSAVTARALQIANLRRAVALWDAKLRRLAEKFGDTPEQLHDSPTFQRLLQVRDTLRGLLAKATLEGMLDLTRMK